MPDVWPPAGWVRKDSSNGWTDRLHAEGTPSNTRADWHDRMHPSQGEKPVLNIALLSMQL